MKKFITALLLTVVAAVPAFAKEDMTVQSCRNTEGLTTKKISEAFGRPDKYEDSIYYWNDNVYAELKRKAMTVSHTICIPLKSEQQVKAFPVPIKPLPVAEVDAVKKVFPEINKLTGIINKSMDSKHVFNNYFKPFVATLPDQSFLATKDYYTTPRFNMMSVNAALTAAGYNVNQTGETALTITDKGITYNLYIPSWQGQKWQNRTAKLESIVINGKTYYITVKDNLENGKAYEAFIATQKIIATNDIGRGERMDLVANYREYGLSFQHDIGKGKVLLIHNNDGIADIKE